MIVIGEGQVSGDECPMTRGVSAHDVFVGVR